MTVAVRWGRCGGRVSSVDEVAAHLRSDAASYVNGIDVLVDGGMIQGMAAGAA